MFNFFENLLQQLVTAYLLVLGLPLFSFLSKHHKNKLSQEILKPDFLQNADGQVILNIWIAHRPNPYMM